MLNNNRIKKGTVICGVINPPKTSWCGWPFWNIFSGAGCFRLARPEKKSFFASDPLPKNPTIHRHHEKLWVEFVFRPTVCRVNKIPFSRPQKRTFPWLFSEIRHITRMLFLRTFQWSNFEHLVSSFWKKIFLSLTPHVDQYQKNSCRR